MDLKAEIAQMKLDLKAQIKELRCDYSVITGHNTLSYMWIFDFHAIV